MCGWNLEPLDDESNLEYVFIAWTSEQFSEDTDDKDALLVIAEKATREAGLPAFWISITCMANRTIEELQDDVHRINDVIRGADLLVIIVGPGKRDAGTRPSTTKLLKDWGSRMWTLPEALLSPQGQSILVYTRGGDLNEPMHLAKKSFPTMVWSDAPVTRQLIDHYEGSLVLSRLELVVIALRCLKNRHTTELFQGDLSYILMGLLLRRPLADPSDSAFQAFARLSLANDSDMLLERVICVEPKDGHESWLSMEDMWDVNLWDIYPSCQIAGVGHDDTVLLDGAYGAAIRWKAFAAVAFANRPSLTRKAARVALHATPLLFSPGVALLATGSSQYIAVGVLLLLCSLIGVLASPWLMMKVYGGKLWAAQPWFFGFEGHLDIESIEAYIFGFNLGRLTWSPYGSALSRHHEDEHHECVGMDPTSDPNISRLVEEAKKSRYGEPKVFTLVDTYTRTVTLFSAVRPPVAVLICGSEGGMQRAIMCSYETRTQTLYRETVLRMETPVLKKMPRISRCRFGLRRPDPLLQRSA